MIYECNKMEKNKKNIVSELEKESLKLGNKGVLMEIAQHLLIKI